MITLKKRLYSKNIKENEVVLDIETTGLDSTVDKLVLLGLVEKEKGKTYIKQYFAENDNEELRLLDIYVKKVKGKKVITYNGDTFDIPFLNNRLIKHQRFPILPDTLDLLKLIKPYRYYFTFDSLKLTDMEKIFYFYRNDPSRYKTISKLTEDIKTRDNPYPIMKHNENDLVATELLINIGNFFDERLSIDTKKGKIILKTAFINNDIANLKFNLEKDLGEAYFSGSNYELILKNSNLTINLQVLYGQFDSNTKGYVSLNNFMIENQTSVRVDEHFLIIKENRIYNYKNILVLAKKIIENHL